MATLAKMAGIPRGRLYAFVCYGDRLQPSDQKAVVSALIAHCDRVLQIRGMLSEAADA